MKFSDLKLPGLSLVAICLLGCGAPEHEPFEAGPLDTTSAEQTLAGIIATLRVPHEVANANMELPKPASSGGAPSWTTVHFYVDDAALNELVAAFGGADGREEVGVRVAHSFRPTYEDQPGYRRPGLGYYDKTAAKYHGRTQDGWDHHAQTVPLSFEGVPRDIWAEPYLIIHTPQGNVLGELYHPGQVLKPNGSTP